MKKCLAVFLALISVVCCLSASFADDPDEIPGTADMPYAGLRFVPPEEYRSIAGRIVTDGAEQLGQNVLYAYWLYAAMTEDELNSLYSASTETVRNSPLTVLFYVFSIGNGMDFDGLNDSIGSPFDSQYAHEIGRVDNYIFYLYMEPNQDFLASVEAPYAEEYRSLVSRPELAVSAFTCYQPLDKYADLIGLKVEFTTTDLDGNPVSSADLFAQHEITMVNIWATWCGPCIGELAELQQIHLRLLEKDCAVVGLLNDTDLDSARSLVSENGVTYPVILAPENFYNLFPIEYYPSSFFINRNGEFIAAPIVGAAVSQYEPVLESLLQK